MGVNLTGPVKWEPGRRFDRPCQIRGGRGVKLTGATTGHGASHGVDSAGRKSYFEFRGIAADGQQRREAQVRVDVGRGDQRRTGSHGMPGSGAIIAHGESTDKMLRATEK